MKILHIVPGTRDVSNGMLVVAKLLAKEHGEAEVVDLNHVSCRMCGNDVDEVWVHGMWLPREWLACWRVVNSGKRLVRMTHGSLSPVYLKSQSPWKKCLVGSIERWCLRRSNKIVATCEAEKGWVGAYLGKKCPPVEVADIKRFFKLGSGGVVSGGVGSINSQLSTHNSQLHLLYLGRRHPLKGLEYLEEAVKGIEGVELRVVSNAFGDEKEKVWDWCDVLVLPTLSENFGLVIAEALERGKRVITTDGAPAWGDGNDYGGRLVYLKGYRDGTDEIRKELLNKAIISLV